MPEDVQGGRRSLETYRERAKAISGSHRFREPVGFLLAEIHKEKYGSAAPSTHIKEGIPKPIDLKRMGSFYKANGGGRATLIDAFDDERYREISLRIIAAGQPDALPDADLRRWKKWWKDRVTVSRDVAWFTIQGDHRNR